LFCCGLVLCTTPACFSTFLSIYYRPYSSLKFLIFEYTSLLIFFANNLDYLINPSIPQQWFRMRAPIISENEVSIMVLCLLCSPSYTAVCIKNCSKSISVIKVAAVKNTIVPHAPTIVRNWSVHCPPLSAMFNSLHSSTNQEKHLCNQGSHHEKYRQFSLHKGSYHVQTSNQHFSLLAKMNGTQRRMLVSPWRIHYTYCGMPIGTSRAEATLNSENVKPIALAVIELCLTEGIS